MSDERPVIQLFIKSSTIDKEQKGSCPLCQQWFMAAWILAEQKILNFHVTIVDAASPPKEFKELSQSKIFPVVKGIRGLDKRGQDIGEKLADDHEGLEQFFESFGYPGLKRDGSVQKHFDDLYKFFNLFLQSPSDNGEKLTQKLEKLNAFLESEDEKYVIKDYLTYGDCYLMPRLQHIKVAAREYKGYEIPHEFFYVWRYLYFAYKTLAFLETCPTDQDIVKHYETKAGVKPIRGEPNLQKASNSYDIPASVLSKIPDEDGSVPEGNGTLHGDD